MHGTLHCVNGIRRSRPISMAIKRIACNLLGLVAATELSSRSDARAQLPLPPRQLNGAPAEVLH